MAIRPTRLRPTCVALSVPFEHELVIRKWWQPLDRSFAVQTLTPVVHVFQHPLQNPFIGRLRLLNGLVGHHARHPERLGGILQPAFIRFQTNLEIVATHESMHLRLTFLMDLFKATLLHLEQEWLPLQAIPDRPVLAGRGLALDFLGDGLPGMTNGPHFRGDVKKGFEILLHGRSPRRQAAMCWAELAKSGSKSDRVERCVCVVTRSMTANGPNGRLSNETVHIFSKTLDYRFEADWVGRSVVAATDYPEVQLAGEWATLVRLSVPQLD